VTDERVDFVMQYGGRCRDCADADGVCPASGLPCKSDEARRAIRHTLSALDYGYKHGFLRRAEQTEASDE
jgi:hypothetical protein